jgi:hypothetical protein
MRGRPQRALMIQAMATASLAVGDIAARYRARGGTASPETIGEYLRGLVDLPSRESDLLADIVNDLCRDTSSTLPVPQVAHDAADGSSETSRRDLGATGAFLLSDAEKEQARLDAVDRTNLLDTASEERFDRITHNAQRRFQVSTAIITLIDNKRQFLKSVIGPVEQNMPRTRSFCNNTIKNSSPLIVRDTFHDDQLKWNPLVLGEPFIRFYAGYPLRGPDGWIVGTLCIIDQRTRSFSQADERSLRRLARMTEHELNA